MFTVEELRKASGKLDHVSDEDLAHYLHKTYGPDMAFEAFAPTIGYDPVAKQAISTTTTATTTEPAPIVVEKPYYSENPFFYVTVVCLFVPLVAWLAYAHIWQKGKTGTNGALCGFLLALSAMGAKAVLHPTANNFALLLIGVVTFSTIGALIGWAIGKQAKSKAAKIKVATSDEAHYEQISREIESGTQHAATWTRAFVAADGDATKQKLKYIEQRLIQLREDAKAAASVSATETPQEPQTTAA